MSELPPIRPTKMSVNISTDGNTARLSFTDEDSRSCAIELSLEGIDWLIDELPHLFLSAQGEHALGKKSALVPGRSGPQLQIPTHAVLKFLLIGYEEGGRVLEFLTHKHEAMRFALSPELATDLSMALAPGGDQLPPDSKTN
jgi:hypothetical protein